MAKVNIKSEKITPFGGIYYASKANRGKAKEDDEEADKAAANIKRILSTRTLAFNTNGYISTHRRFFEGVFKHAGRSA